MKKIFLLLSAIILTGCFREVIPGPEKVIKLNPDSVEETKLSKVFGNYDYLELSSKENTPLIGDIHRMEVTEDRIYILDAFQALTLNVYDRKGELIFNISNVGRGPGEFLGPYSFAIDEKAERIIIYDGAGLKLCFYDIENGTFIEEKPLEFAISKFKVLSNGYVFFLNNRTYLGFSYNIIITDKDLSIIDKKLKIDSNMANYQFEFPVNFTSFESNYFLTVPGYYEIYQVNKKNGRLKKHLTVDFGDRSLPTSFYDEHQNNQSRFNEIGDAAHNISGYFEDLNFIYFNYDVGAGGQQQYYFESKKDSLVVHSNYDNLIDDINLGPLPRWPRAKINNKLVWPQEPTVLLKFIQQKKESLTANEWEEFKSQNKKLITFGNSITKDSNPYLIFTEVSINE